MKRVARKVMDRLLDGIIFVLAPFLLAHVMWHKERKSEATKDYESLHVRS